MDVDEVDYFQGRAEQELRLAQEASHAAAARAHFVLANSYLELVHNSPHAPNRPRPAIFQ
jgi:hypothetical protein